MSNICTSKSVRAMQIIFVENWSSDITSLTADCINYLNRQDCSVSQAKCVLVERNCVLTLPDFCFKREIKSDLDHPVRFLVQCRVLPLVWVYSWQPKKDISTWIMGQNAANQFCQLQDSLKFNVWRKAWMM